MLSTATKRLPANEIYASQSGVIILRRSFLSALLEPGYTVTNGSKIGGSGMSGISQKTQEADIASCRVPATQ